MEKSLGDTKDSLEGNDFRGHKRGVKQSRRLD